MSVSLITTVKNEREHIEAWLDSLCALQQGVREVVVVDGGSTDGTYEWLKEVGMKQYSELKVVQKEGNISVGRNEAIRQASGDIIVVADAGCRYGESWFEAITGPIVEGKATVSATAFGPWFFESDTLKAYLLAAATTPAPEEFRRDWLPSSRSVAFTKTLWQAVGGYPEWLPICEDVVFDLALRDTGASFAYVRQPLVFWRPRPTLKQYLRQVYKYTRGDGHANLWLHRQVIRYVVYGGLLTSLFLFAQGGYYLLFAPVVFVGACLYIKKFWQRFSLFARPLSDMQRFLGYFLLPGIIMLGDGAKMVGYVVGVWQRLRGEVVPPQSNTVS